MTERRSADTRNKILEIAESEFAREGFAGAHLQHIAEQVGVRKTALYYHFPSKAALYAAVLTRMLDDFERTVVEGLASEGDLRQRLSRLLDGMNDLLAERPHYSRILFRLFVDPPRLEGSGVRERVERIVGRVLRFYREGVDAGVFRPLSSRHVLQSLLGATLFHYASGSFGAALFEQDLFTARAVAWRRDELRELILRGVYPDGFRD